MGKGIEKMCMDMLIRQQPVAKDLRRISSSFRLVYDSRRIATQVIDIKDTLDFMDEVDLVFETSVLKIGQKAEAQLKTAQKMHRATCLLCRKECKRDMVVPAGMAAVEMARHRPT